MKHPTKLILLFILSGVNAIFNIIISIVKYDTLEHDISRAMTNLFQKMPDIDPKEFPEFIFIDVSNAMTHYMEYGTVHYYTEFWSHAIALLGVLMMAALKKSGFGIYVLGQLVGLSAIFVGYGFNATIGMGALVYAVLAFVFIKLYQVWFLKSETEFED